MRKVSFVLIFIFLSFCTFGKEKKVKEKREYPTVIEDVQNAEYKIINKNGMLFIKANVKIENERSFPFIFLIDTGSASSYAFLESFSQLQEYFSVKIDGIDYILCKAFFDGFIVENLLLNAYRNQNAYVKELRQIFNDNDYYFGILGNDVLMNKSLMLSISKGIFKWTDINPLLEAEKTFCPVLDRICSKRGNIDYYQYSIYIDDKYFKSDVIDNPNFGFFNSPDKTKSRYFIDTGTYYIATSNIDLYYQIKNRNLKSFTFNSEIMQKFGYATIDKPFLLGKQFDSLECMSGGTPEMLKCLGNQFLAAYDIYFDKENTEKVQKIYFQQINATDYEKYRLENDKTYYYPASTFGFRANNALNRVTEKAFVNGDEYNKDIEIGDIIISINDVKYDEVKEWELPDYVTIQVKKRDGKIIKRKIQRMYLKG